ncbi:HutD family protein [Rhizobium sp. ARZ01]|uniref:HutD/Ves family protein n=1 Tax=Rhizobium sp. ARZ01 TaxID=2769313 RepID=UPI001781A381|nr:HutD family protein [Rhizobium sp. ARZ01]MBD9371855.1 HutD family protein [Rhizobium sp. ARZ01]
MHIVRSEDYRRMRWKNGDGETAEIAVFPPEAGLSDFDWRVSMAAVAADGPFSSFPGIDRTLSILEGEGMTLEIEGKPAITLTTRSDPLAFPADVPTTAALVKGPIVDLNVMSRRTRWTHRVEKWHVEGQHHFDAPGGVTMILTLGNLRVDAGHHAVELRRHDCIFIEDVVLLTTDMPVEGYLVRFTKS